MTSVMAILRIRLLISITHKMWSPIYHKVYVILVMIHIEIWALGNGEDTTHAAKSATLSRHEDEYEHALDPVDRVPNLGWKIRSGLCSEKRLESVMPLFLSLYFELCCVFLIK